MEKIKNICRDLGKAFTIGLLSGGAAAAVLLLGGFLFGGFTFRAALEAAKDGLLLIAALGMFVIAGYSSFAIISATSSFASPWDATG